MAVNRFSSNFKERNDIFSSITPPIVINREISAPAGEWKPAAWLPIQFTKSNIAVGTDAFVISTGKVVSLDREGRVVPAGLREKLQGGAASLVYTQTDVDYGVVDLVTGERLTGTQSYSSVDVAEAIIERGLVPQQEVIDNSGTVPPTLQAHADIIIDLFIQAPIGIAAYDMYVWSGRPEDEDQYFTNYSKQHLVQFLTEGQLKMPHFVAGTEAADSWAVATVDGGGTETAADGDMVDAGEYWNATNLAALTRYAELGITTSSPVVAIGLDPDGDGTQYRVAKNTTRTPVGVDTDGVLVRERSDPSLINQEGDWWLDDELGVLFLHSSTWATGVADTATWVFSYNYYDTAATTGHRYTHFDGPASPTIRVTFDSESNFVAAVEGTTAERDIIGRVLEIQRFPKGEMLAAVKTGFPGLSSSTSKMPGSATAGYPDYITLSPEVVADQIVIVHFRI
jgi:hypothetical protein